MVVPPPPPLKPPPPPPWKTPVSSFVMTWNDAEPEPTVTVAVTAVRNEALETNLMRMESPLFTVQDAEEYVPPFTEYSPPETLTSTGTLIQEITTAGDSVRVERFAFVTVGNENASGTTSGIAATAKSEKFADWNAQSPAEVTEQLVKRAYVSPPSADR